jgi:uncharacterized peroxidase-related enzyme
MSRLGHVEPARAEGEARSLLDQAQRQLGMVPNFMKVFASSPPTLAAFMGLNGNLHRGRLDAKTRERIALVTGESNACRYCVSAHTALAHKAGLDDGEIQAARRGGSSDARADAAVKFAQALLEHRGDVTAAELRAVREAGFDDGQIVEIIANVGLNVLTNLLGKAAQIDIDFPEIELLGETAA